VFADVELYIISPQDGDSVGGELRVSFGLRGTGVAPAGVDVVTTGHYHLLTDVDTLPDPGCPGLN